MGQETHSPEKGRGSAATLEDILSFSGKEWVPIPRVSRYIPFGYRVFDDDPNVLHPVVLELETLEQAKDYLKKGHSLRAVAEWVTEATGREISHAGLKKRVDVDRSRRTKSQSLKRWAARYKEALQKAFEFDRRSGNLREEEWPEDYWDWQHRQGKGIDD